jgi:mannan endo-1,4-beta-mannosidase
MLHA